ncbi:MAG: ferrochelatase [Rhodospirillaceae bacterium]|jgi:protoporphyrin/coproporphyrin ferrochelatase|nr:ferrochelatase [Rhodospirillaceae bacterium]MBT7956442.1 ferrochelatase [Rhodospirillaceae bacterium]
MPARPKKRAVVLFNLGGPDEPSAIQPFLFNLFNDPAIISLPQPLRWCLAKLISKRRSPVAQKIYAEIGGRSPLLDLTREQAAALEDQLGAETEVFISMRYWHPLSASTARAVKNYDPDEIILLPLYPQFSTTTTGSSLEDWHRAAREIGLHKPTKSICCYPAETNLIKAQAKLLAEHLAPQSRVLFSAHGLPKKMIDKGDPYQWQIEQTAAAIAAEADLQIDQWRICYQSRVGRLEWIGPSLDEELERAAADNIGVTILPIAFVSEHSETLVELDIEYREMADKLKLPAYNRVPAVGTQPDFISGLAKLVESASVSEHNLISGHSNLAGRNCPADRIGCPQ